MYVCVCGYVWICHAMLDLRNILPAPRPFLWYTDIKGGEMKRQINQNEIETKQINESVGKMQMRFF